MFAGDSIMEGFDSTGTLGVRKAVSWYIQNNGLGIDLVGPNSTGTMPDAHHCCQSGASSATITTNITSALATFSPRLLILDMGINDVANNAVPGATAAAANFTRMQTIMNAMLAKNPLARIIYTTLMPLPAGDTYEAEIAAYNSAWTTPTTGYVAQFNALYPSNPMAMIDWNTAMAPYSLTYMDDRVHPTTAGFNDKLVPATLTHLRTVTPTLRSFAPAINALGCTITSPTAGATVTVGVPVNVTVTITRSPRDCSVAVKNTGGSTLGAGTAADLDVATLTYSWTPQAGDVGAFTLNATVTDSVSSTSANAAGVSLTVQAAAGDPLTILSGRTFLWWVRSDLGVVEAGGAGTGVTQWQDQSGAGNHWNQAGASNLRPTLNASVAVFNNRPSIGFDGTDDFLANAINLPAPGTLGTWMCHVYRLRAWTSGRMIFGQNSSNCYIKAITASPQLYAHWGALGASNSGGTINTPVRLKLLIGNTAADYMQIGAEKDTGLLGNQDAAAGLGMGAANNGTMPSNCEWVESFAISGGDPTTQQLSDIDSYLVTRYGVGLLV
jgi:lysophospholipase L1-like esterase